MHDLAWSMSIGLLFLGIILSSGCVEQPNQTVSVVGNAGPDLLEDMELRPVSIPLLSSSVSDGGLMLENSTTGIFRDGTLVFQGTVRNGRDTTARGYVVLNIEVIDNRTGIPHTNPPVVLGHDMMPGSSAQYFSVTARPFHPNSTSYRYTLQLTDRYPGV